MSKINWLNRMVVKGPRLVLCLNEAEYNAVIKFMVVADPDQWLDNGCGACVHHFRSSDGGNTCVVCLNDVGFESSIELASVLVHESVHIWQELRAHMGEESPSREFEAYSIENISKTLMEEYARKSMKGLT